MNAPSTEPARIGWLSSGRDPAARNLLADVVARAAADRLSLNIAAVFCNKSRGESPESDAFLDLVDSLGFAAVTLPSAASWSAAQSAGTPRSIWRDAYHDQVMATLDPYRLDVLVLAGYMLILSPAMCARYAILNLHPALPGGPIGMWQDVIWQLLREDARETGALMNLVTPELDRGPVVSFDRFPIVGGGFDPLWERFAEKRRRLSVEQIAAAEGEAEPLFAAIRHTGERREIPLLYQTVRQFVLGTIHAEAGRVSSQLGLPLDLTEMVNRELEERS